MSDLKEGTPYNLNSISNAIQESKEIHRQNIIDPAQYSSLHRALLELDNLIPQSFSYRELATVLAALRFWQKEMIAMSGNKPENQEMWAKDTMPEHFDPELPLAAIEIDALCERLNQ